MTKSNAGAKRKPIDINLMVSMVKQGKTNQVIGDYFGVTEATIRNRRKELRKEAK